jgi:hypothetical protein
VATNITSYDALNVHACNAASKNYPTVVPMDEFRSTLRNAVDTIGAYSLKNPAWAAAAAAAKIPTPSPPPWIVPGGAKKGEPAKDAQGAK